MRRVPLVLAAAATLLGVSAASAAGASIWSIVPSPSPGSDVFNADLEGVSATSITDAWAVGSDSADGQSGGLAEHWNGTLWAVTPTPGVPGRTAALHDVAALSPTDAWAVGETTVNGATETETLIEHWDGARWTIVPSPNVATGATAANTLTGISELSARDIWAAGWAIEPTSSTIQLLFEHWNGRRWKIAASPTPPGAFQFATAVTAIAKNDVWAVGFDDSGSPERNVSAHWNGRAWSLVPAPNLEDGQPPDNALQNVTAVASNDVWAVGQEQNLGGVNRQRPVTLHWNGSAWSIVPAPSTGTGGSELFGVTALRSSDVWAVGESRNFNTGVQQSLTMQWNGGSWSVVPSPSNVITTTALDATSLPGGMVWAVGGTELRGQCCLRTLVLQTGMG